MTTRTIRLNVVALILLVSAGSAAGQQRYIDKKKLFSDTSTINASLTLNFKRLLAKRNKEGYLVPATFSCKLDSLTINDHIAVEVRGHFRRSYCYIPPLKLIYKNDEANAFYRLKSLKLVSNCKLSADDDQNLLKEYLVYKIYNLITDKSFRVRLLNLNYVDSLGGKTRFTRHAFLLEDVKELAKRNDCTDWTDKRYQTERTDRRQMTTVAIFQYMIGNTDWAVPVNHNIKLLHTNADSTSKPYVVPYDFDYSGFVNTEYAIPDERLGIEKVRERVYRGFPRNMEELNMSLATFKAQKNAIYALINNFNLLTERTKKDVEGFLDEFYASIDDPDKVKYQFISQARTR